MKVSRAHLSKAQIAMMTAYLAINAEKLTGMSPTQVAQLINKNVTGISTCTAHHAKAYAPLAGVVLKQPNTRQPSEEDASGSLKHRVKSQDDRLYSAEKRLAAISTQITDLNAWRREKEPMFVAVFECAQKNASELDNWLKALGKLSDRLDVLNRRHEGLLNSIKMHDEQMRELSNLIRSCSNSIAQVEDSLTKPEQPNGLETN